MAILLFLIYSPIFKLDFPFLETILIYHLVITNHANDKDKDSTFNKDIHIVCQSTDSIIKEETIRIKKK